MFKKVFILVLSLSFILTGCSTTEQQTPTVGQNNTTAEMSEYDKKLVPETFKEHAKDLRTKPLFDISTIFVDDVNIQDDFYDAQILFNDVTILGTTLGDLYDVFVETGLVNEKYNLDFEVAPYHQVEFSIGTFDAKKKNFLGDDKLQGEVYAVNLTGETVLAKDCLITGYHAVCENGPSKWGFNWDLNELLDEMEEDTGRSVRKYNEYAEGYNLHFNDSDKLDKAYILFKMTLAEDYLKNNFNVHEASDDAIHTMQAGDKVYDLETLSFAQFILDLHVEDERALDELPTVKCRSPFKEFYEDYETIVDRTEGIAGLAFGNTLNGVIQVSSHAAKVGESVNCYELPIFSVESYTADSEIGAFKLYDVVANETESKALDNFRKLAEDNGFESRVEPWETTGKSELIISTGYGELRYVYPETPSTTEQNHGFSWVHYDLKK